MQDRNQPMPFDFKNDMDKNTITNDLEEKKGAILNANSLSEAPQAPAQEMAEPPVREVTPKRSIAENIKEKRLSQTNATLNV